MNRIISLMVLLVSLSVQDVSSAQQPLKNETAREAQRAHAAAIAKANADYVAKLEIAIKEAGAAGDLEEANRIAALKDDIEMLGSTKELDEVERVQKKLEGTRWGPSARTTLKLYPNRKVIFAQGYPGTWILSDPETLLLQSSRTSNISVWKFDEKLRSVRIFTFSQIKKDEPVIYQKY